MTKLTVIVPCYNEEEALRIFYKAINKVVDKMSVKFGLILINDGSKDKTLDIMRDLAHKDKNVRYVSFSRNFSKEAAMLAGLEAATGDYVTIMDVDLQDPPALLEEMYNTLETTDYDCVGSRRVTRKGEPVIRSFFARCYYKLINKISKTEIDEGARDFRLMTRQMVNSILELKEYNRYSKGIFSWVGYKTKWLEYENVERSAGKTKWNFGKLFAYSIESIVDFSTVPLMISLAIGILFCLVSLVLLIVIIIKLCNNQDFNLLFLGLTTIIFFVGGMQLFFLGVIGKYLAN